MSSEKTRTHLFKIVVVGDMTVGKTSIIHRYVHGYFSENYKSTIGVDFALKIVNWDRETDVKLQLWDIAGQERFGNMTRIYYKEASGALIVFDLSRETTYKNILKWKEDIDEKVRLPNDNKLPVMLLANKSDLERNCPLKTDEDFEEFCKENEFEGWGLTSAKFGQGIDEVCNILIKKLVDTCPSQSKSREDLVDIIPEPKPVIQKDTGCCS